MGARLMIRREGWDGEGCLFVSCTPCREFSAGEGLAAGLTFFEYAFFDSGIAKDLNARNDRKDD